MEDSLLLNMVGIGVPGKTKFEKSREFSYETII